MTATSEDTTSPLRPLLEQGMALHQQNRLDEALAIYQQILQTDPLYYDALHMVGVIKLQQCLWQEAIAVLLQAQQLHDHQATLYFHLGLAYFGQLQLEEAIDAFSQVIRIDPEVQMAYRRRAEVLTKAGRYQEAMADVRHVLTQQQNDAELWHLQGDLYCYLKQNDAAIVAYRKAIDLQPMAKTWINMGNAYKQMVAYENALEAYTQAQRLNAEYPVELLYNRANTLRLLNRFTEAQLLLNELFKLTTTFANAWFVQGIIYKEQKLFNQAIEAFATAAALDEHIDFLAGEQITAEMRLCNWQHWEQITQILQTNSASFFPFLALSLTDDPALQLKIAQDYSKSSAPPLPGKMANSAHPPSQRTSHRVRIGYFSADFRNHALSFLMAGVLECHDRQHFEIHVFSFGIPTKDAMRQRIEQNVEYFHDVYNQTDSAIVSLAQAMGLHIAIDLTGHTAHSRMSLFAQRLAPVQVNYLGFPGTSGAPYIDYLIADSHLVPADQAIHYQEHLVYMPDSFQANDSKRRIAPLKMRADYGLPQEALIYASFNNSYKINPDMFSVWMQILKANPRIILWLLGENPQQIENLKTAASQQGVDSQRLFFGSQLEYAQHLARLAQVDLILDTLPFNGGTSTSDALWAGAPVLTCAGQSFSGRMSTSLLQACHMPSLICRTMTEYMDKAISLSNNPQQLIVYKKHLALYKRQLPLFDTIRFTRHLEQAFQTMHNRWQQGHSGAAIYVESLAASNLPSV